MRHQAIYETHSNVVCINGDSDAYDSNGNLVEINETLVTSKMAELQTDYDSKQYQRDRVRAYPSIGDQLDNIFHNGIDAWKADIQAIKDQFPKP